METGFLRADRVTSRAPGLVAVLAGVLSIVRAVVEWIDLTVPVPFDEYLNRPTEVASGLAHQFWFWFWAVLAAVVVAVLALWQPDAVLLLTSAGALTFLTWTNDPVWNEPGGMAFLSQDQVDVDMLGLLWSSNGMVVGVILLAGGMISALVRTRR